MRTRIDDRVLGNCVLARSDQLVPSANMGLQRKDRLNEERMRPQEDQERHS